MRAPGQQVGRLERHAGDLQRADDLLPADADAAGLAETAGPVTSFITVDLPQPDGPTMAANSPSAIDNVELVDGGRPPCPP